MADRRATPSEFPILDLHPNAVDLSGVKFTLDGRNTVKLDDPKGWEGWDHGRDDWRLSLPLWRELEGIVTAAGGDAQRLGDYRGRLEWEISAYYSRADQIAVKARESVERENKVWQNLFAVSGKLSRLILKEKERGLFGKNSLSNTHAAFGETEAEQLIQILTKFTEASDLLAAKSGGRIRLDRDSVFRSIIWFWAKWLKLPVRKSISSPVIRFVQVIANHVGWFLEHDKDPENIRAFIRKWEKEEESGFLPFPREENE